MEENEIKKNKEKVRKIFKRLAESGENLHSKEDEEIPKSITFTKTALPILYSNLILIEDMKYENSNYFLGSNGFISKKINLSSLRHDQNFSLSNCAFRIFPRTYNVNKYKVLDFINEKGEVDYQDINFKFSGEIFNNLDIVQNKFGEPVRYGDIIMLMHDNTHMFIKYVNSTKSLTFSNHDGDATLFSVEPATEIMLNDNQILKAGQPIRLKVAGFNYANQNLYFGLSVPYSTSNKLKEIEASSDEDNDDDNEEISKEEEQIENNPEEMESKEVNNDEKLLYDKTIKKYTEKPDLVIEENSTMKWRFVLYNSFTTKEDFISFGDFIQIMYCDKNSILGALSEEKEIKKGRLFKESKKLTLKMKRRDSFDLKENILVDDDEEILIDDIDDKDLSPNTEYKNSEFYLSNHTSYNKNSNEDINSAWILENIYPNMKMQSFIRFYEDEKMDTYHMTFRIRHFKTNKILSIIEVDNENSENIFYKDDNYIMKGEGINDNKIYKFDLIDDIMGNTIDKDKINSDEYKRSLFGFKKTNKSKSYDSTTPSINDFVKLYHVKTHSYIKIIISDHKKKSILNFDDILKCKLILIKYPDEKEVVKIERLHYNTQWKFKFIQNLYHLTCYIIENIRIELGEMKNRDLDTSNNINNNESLEKIKADNFLFSGEENIEISNFTKLKFVLDKLFKFIMNKFINKYDDYCGFNNIVNNRQLLVSYFDFTNLFLVKLIYFFWFHDNNLGRIRAIEKILLKLKNDHEANNYLRIHRNKALFQMFRYTESIFQFIVVYCKDNSHIKKELYQYLYVFLLFINLSSPCIDALVEIFKNEESNLNFILRDCVENKKLKSILELLFKEYFPEYYKSKNALNDNIINTSENQIINNQQQATRKYTLFDLVLEYLKISEYNCIQKYDINKINIFRRVCNVISFNSREKYVELLISLIHMDNKANIQDNQIYLIEKIAENNYILEQTLSGDDNNYPSCLINLIYEMTKDTKINDENNVNLNTLRIFHNFIFNNPYFKEDNLEKINSEPYLCCNSKMYAYIKENIRKNDDQENVSIFFKALKNKFNELFQFPYQNNSIWYINFLESQQVELACSIIQFMEKMIQIDLLNPLEEKDFLYTLVSFLTLKYKILCSERVSSIIQTDMIIKEKSIYERIAKTEHEKYISISETWHKIYQIFRRLLMIPVEEKFYSDLKKKKIANDTNNLKLKKLERGHKIEEQLINNNTNNILENSSSQHKLVDSEEKNSTNSKERNNNIYRNKLEMIPNAEINGITINSAGIKKNQTNDFDRLIRETRNYENIIREDLKKEKNILFTRHIVSIFRLLIRKNLNYLKSNFIEYYLEKTRKKEDFYFQEFVERCIPNIEDKNYNINRLIQRYSKEKIENYFSSSGCINLNKFFDLSKSDDFNFIKNIIISFATSEEEETQEILIGLIYKYFHQRRKLLRDIYQFNEYLLPDNRDQIRNIYSDRGQEIKVVFDQFYQNYEFRKNRYDLNKYEKIEFFLNSLIKETLILFKHIFIYWKSELTFKNNINYEKQKIDYMIEKIKFIENSINGDFSTKVFIDNLSHANHFLYYIRNNYENQYISSIISILNEHGEIYLKMYFSLLNDLIDKGKAISSYFEIKKYRFFSNNNLLSSNLEASSAEKRLSIKNKLFINIVLLIILGNIILPKDEKSLRYLFNLLEEKIDLLNYDSYSRHLILLLITDIQKLSFSVDYFFVFNKCSKFFTIEYFGTLDSDYKTEYPICFSILYLDIIYNVLSFIIYQNKMINETYLDEFIVDTFLLLLKKMNMKKDDKSPFLLEINNDNPECRDKIKLIIKLIKTVNLMSNVEQLNRVMMLKIDPFNSRNFNRELLNIYFNESKENDSKKTSIVLYFPLPHHLYQLLIKYLNELYNDTGQKLTEERALRYTQNIFELYKYILYYIVYIGINDLVSKDTEDTGDKDLKKNIQNLILYILGGYSYITNKNDIKEIDSQFINEQSGEIKSLFEQIAHSSFYLLFNLIAIVKYFDFCQKDINEIKIDQEEIKKNIKILFDDFKQKTLDEDYIGKDLHNIDFNLKKEIEIKTTDKISVNTFILNQLEEILSYTIIMDTSSSSQNLFEHDELVNLLQIIKKMIKEYEKREPKNKSDMLKFQTMLIENKKELHTIERIEATSIIYYVLSFLDGDNKTTIQTEVIFSHFIQKSVDFIKNTLNLNIELTIKRIKHMTYLIYIIKKILSFYEKKETDLIASNFKKKTLREIQMLIEKTGLIKICLQFIKRYDDEKLLPFINMIFKMFCKMLKFGQADKEMTNSSGSNGQKLFYNTFNLKNEFEQVFYFMTETINKKIQTIISNKFLIVRNKKNNLSIQNQLLLEEYGGEIDENILEFLQLLCENHNKNLQLYLHKQKNFKRDYDLVTDTQHYLNILFNNFEPFLFNSLCRCFDLLIEMVQGPCFDSQILLINSKLLVTINDLLRYYLNSGIDKLREKFDHVESFKLNENSPYKSIDRKEEDEIQQNISFKQNFDKMSTKQISLLTYKATILLQALVDSRNKFDDLYKKMMDVISGETLKKIYIKVYFEHLFLISETNEINDYLIRLNDFNRANIIDNKIEDEFDVKKDKNEVDENPEEYLILETGFYAYFLYRYYEDFNSTSPSNQKKQLKKKSKWEKVKQIFKSTFFVNECWKFLSELFYAVLKTICLLIGLIILLITFGKVKKFNLIRDIFNRKEYKDEYAEEFYEQSTASIEVLKEENVYIIYFFKLPFCNGLNRFEREQFKESIDRTNNQSKLMDIMRYSDQVKYELEADYKIKEIASKIPILGVILTNIEFWKDLSLLISISLNLLNFLASHYEQTATNLCVDENICIEIKKWKEIQTLGGLTEGEYDRLIQSLSFFQCIVGCLIYAEYMARKLPTFYKLNRELAEELNYTGYTKTFFILRKTIYEIATSFSVIYYTGVVVFGFLGIYKSNFFFSYLLLEIISRVKTLQNVLFAIKNPYKELILIFILWVILIYYFSIIGYVWFRDSEFPRPDKDCNSLLKCVATIFHQNNRMDNGISGYLKKRSEISSKNPFTWRFFYDEIGNLLLKILIVNMIAGIIIDNFATLRKNETQMYYDMNNICTICTLKKDKIIKIYKNYGKSYDAHLKKDHNFFNYIFYIIYLYKKEKTELNGMESYIYELAFVQKDITWFPTKKLYIAKPEELEINSDEEDDDEDSDD